MVHNKRRREKKLKVVSQKTFDNKQHVAVTNEAAEIITPSAPVHL